jgi:hypothetical protein
MRKEQAAAAGRHRLRLSTALSVLALTLGFGEARG